MFCCILPGFTGVDEYSLDTERTVQNQECGSSPSFWNILCLVLRTEDMRALGVANQPLIYPSEEQATFIIVVGVAQPQKNTLVASVFGHPVFYAFICSPPDQFTHHATSRSTQKKIMSGCTSGEEELRAEGWARRFSFPLHPLAPLFPSDHLKLEFFSNLLMQVCLHLPVIGLGTLSGSQHDSSTM